MGRLGRDLEERARSFRKKGRREDSRTPSSHLAFEIALVSERLDRIRRVQESHLIGLLREECGISTDLKRLDSYLPRVFTYSPKIRENMKKRLSEFNKERRRLTREHEKESAELQDRLFRLLRQHEELGRR